MGLQDRDYYWERKKREKQYASSLNKSIFIARKNRFFNLSHFVSFCIGAAMAFFVVMVILSINAGLLSFSYELFKGVVER